MVKEKKELKLVETKSTKKKTVKTKSQKVEKELKKEKEKYYETVGRRKEAVARVRLCTKKLSDKSSENKILITVNGKPHHEYFHTNSSKEAVEAPFKKLKAINRFKATVKVNGGGITGQAEAIRHGITRALIKFDQNFSKKLKKAKFLTRDPRAKERRKYGLKKARKSPQWRKR